MKKIRKRFTALLLTALMLIGTLFPVSVLAYSDFKETSTGIPTVCSPMFGTNTTAPVGSSWNEPRTSTSGGSDTPHRGVDQSVTSVSVGPMYGTAYIYYQGGSSTGSAGYYQVIRYVNGSTTFYSVYMHLNGVWKFSQGQQVYLSDVTATTGNTGPSGTPYHLHFELLSYYGSTLDYNRITINPANYASVSISQNFTVFKNFSIVYNSPANLYKTVSVTATDYNLGSPQNLSYVNIYYRVHGTNTWYGPYSMSGSGGTFNYPLYGEYSGETYDIIIAGRRSTSEYWATYPAKHSGDNVGNSSSIPLSNYTDWNYISTTF